ncbi:MAG: ORF6N domain-containing protein [Candidatus Campbellbacteria bacterium]|nr:ORF6N domain-containing protein [Candidatus Campbellbacteria bacterium]
MKALTLETLAERIYFIRNKRVMTDSDLAELYEVTTKVLNQAVRRNMERFPEDFMFQLTKEENLIFQSGTSGSRYLKSQFVTSRSWGGRRKPVFVFTQEGVAMLSGILRSPRAVQVNIVIMRAFVHLREILSTHKELLQRLIELEKKYDERFRIVFEAIQQMMREPDPPRHPIGFQPNTK